MRQKDKNKRDVDECAERIILLLKEYNCGIEYDEELDGVVCVDIDNNDFCDL